MLDNEIARVAERKARRIAKKPLQERIGYSGHPARLATQIQAGETAEGGLIARSLAVALAKRTRCYVMDDVHVPLSPEALTLAAAANGNDACELRNGREGSISQVDVVTYDPGFREATLYEVKRGTAPIGSNHRRLRLLEHAALRIAGAAVLEARLGAPVESVSTLVVSYWGRSGFPSDITLTAGELDEFFQVPVRGEIDAHLNYFRYQLDLRIPGLTGVVYPTVEQQTTAASRPWVQADLQAA